MKELIFKRGFFFRFIKNEYEKEYQSFRDSLFKKYVKWYCLALFLFSISSDIASSIYFQIYMKEISYLATTITSFGITIAYIILLIFAFSEKIKCCRGNKNRRREIMLRSLNYVNYYLILFIFVNFRFALVNWVKIDIIIFYALNTFEIIVRVSWVLLGLLNFSESIILNGVVIASNWIYYISISNVLQSYYFMIAETLAIACVSICSYFYEVQQRRSFYYIKLGEQTNNWFTSVFENMTTGFLNIKNKKIDYANRFLIDNLIKEKDIKDKWEKYENEHSIEILNHNHESDRFKDERKIKFFLENSDYILEKILSNLDFDNFEKNLEDNKILNVIKVETEEIIKTENIPVKTSPKKQKLKKSEIDVSVNNRNTIFFDNFIDKFKVSGLCNCNNFVFIGTKSFKFDNQSK